jgi:hypothetical protein
MSRFQTDALRPSALPSASLGRPRPLTRAEPDAETIPSGDAERDRAHAEWNLRIDREIKGVANGLKEIVELADVRGRGAWLRFTVLAWSASHHSFWAYCCDLMDTRLQCSSCSCATPNPRPQYNIATSIHST